MLAIYYGEEKSTTRLCFGAAGATALREKSVLLVSFVEDDSYERLEKLSNISPYITCLLPRKDYSMREFFDHTVRMALGFSYAMLILGGVFDAIEAGELSASEVYEFLSNAPDSIEIICTGRTVPERFFALAEEIVAVHSVIKEE